MLPLLALALLPARAAPDAASLQAAWERLGPARAQAGRGAVQLSADDLARLARGEVARHRDRLPGADRAVGAIWTALPADALWIAILDDTCFALADGLTERHLPVTAPLHKLLFQHVDVPWPFADRQWILDIRSNSALYRDSGGDAWERTWTLAEDQAGLAAQVPGQDMPADGAVWTPRNDGGWLLARAGEGWIVAYEARVDVGGAVPDDAFTAWTLASLDKLLRTVVQRARDLGGHYGADHAPILRPDGTPVPAL